jgi:hypothetical protein
VGDFTDSDRAMLREILDRLRGGAQTTVAASGGNIAPDSDLDSTYGNPLIKKDPPKWTGASYVGCNYADCPSDYLDSLAGFLDWKAGKDEEAARTASGEEADKKRKYAGYARKDAARARGWAKRNVGKPAAPVQTEAGWGGGGGPDDSVPF